METESALEAIDLMTPSKKTELKDSHRNPESLMPKLSDADRLFQFGGDHEMLSYYLEVREALDRYRRENGSECFCDPRDTRMCTRIQQEGWQPQVTIKDVGALIRDSGMGELGMSRKQTAVGADDKDQTSVGTDTLSSDDDEASDEKKMDSEHAGKSFVCGVQGCNAVFSSLADHESHYHTGHNFVCHVCRRVFVSNFLLDVHLEENHDSYFQVLSPRMDMYRCLVESCASKFRTSDLRKDHLVREHKFPANFSLHRPINDRKSQKVEPSTDPPAHGQSEMAGLELPGPATPISSPSSDTFAASLRPPGSVPTSGMEVDASQDVGSSSDRPQARGGNKRKNRGRASAHKGRGGEGRQTNVPPAICFGRGSHRAFQQYNRGRGQKSRGRHWHQTQQSAGMDTSVDIEKVDFKDMAESLVDCG